MTKGNSDPITANLLRLQALDRERRSLRRRLAEITETFERRTQPLNDRLQEIEEEMSNPVIPASHDAAKGT